MEDIAMLVFYLPIIIFEAMFDVRKVEREPTSGPRLTFESGRRFPGT